MKRGSGSGCGCGRGRQTDQRYPNDAMTNATERGRGRRVKRQEGFQPLRHSFDLAALRLATFLFFNFVALCRSHLSSSPSSLQPLAKTTPAAKGQRRSPAACGGTIPRHSQLFVEWAKRACECSCGLPLKKMTQHARGLPIYWCTIVARRYEFSFVLCN